MSNLTIDDVSRDILYSSNWSTQTTIDPDDGAFFQSTYHSAQADGASANLTFAGASASPFFSPSIFRWLMHLLVIIIS